MATGVHPLPRARRFALSLRAYRTIATACVVALVLIVATGATVRLTGSGLGCEHWPGCEPGHVAPRTFHSDIEFGNRVIAFLVVVLTLATWVGAILAPLSRRLRLLAFSVFLTAVLQAPLGAITIHYKLDPYLVLSHFLLSIVSLTLAVVLAYDVVALERGGHERTLVPGWLRGAAAVVGASLLVLLVSGTLVTASGPYPGSSGAQVARRLFTFEGAVYWHVRATAVFGVSFALLVAWLMRQRLPQLRGALVLLGALLVQMAIGEIQYRTALPWGVVLVHVAVSATVWAIAAAFLYSLWRPLPARRLR